MILVDHNITLNKLRLEDAENLYLLIESNRSYLAKWLPWVKHINHSNDIKKYIEERSKAFLTGDDYSFTIMLKDNNVEFIVGAISLQNIDKKSKTAEIGYWIRENMQGRGIVTRSCKALINFAFNYIQLDNLIILSSTENLKSMAIAERLGFMKDMIILINDCDIPYQRIIYKLRKDRETV